MQEHCEHNPGILDNTTIIRFTHATDSCAGTESHLESLNRALLQRNSMTILFLYMPQNHRDYAPVEHTIGRGRLIKIPLQYTSSIKSQQHLHLRFPLKVLSHKCGYINTRVTGIIKYLLNKRDYLYLSREAIDISSVSRILFEKHSVHLLVNHFIGGLDSMTIMNEAQAAGIPILVVNHYTNNLLQNRIIKKQLAYADKIAGVSGIEIPRHVRSKFINLSNGIDTELFKPVNDIDQSFFQMKSPILLLPARIVKSKGHSDLLKILIELRSQGLPCSAVFAGQEGSSDFKKKLQKFIHTYDLHQSVHFTDSVDPVTLRNWYAASSLVVLPTYQEGLPRVVLEAQAMEKPPLAYNAGGVPEAIIQNETGFYFRKGDRDSLRKKIAELLMNSGKRIQIGKKGRQFILQKFSLSVLAGRHERVYSQIIGKRQSLKVSS